MLILSIKSSNKQQIKAFLNRWKYYTKNFDLLKRPYYCQKKNKLIEWSEHNWSFNKDPI